MGVRIVMNHIGDIQSLIQEYRSQISVNESELTTKILNSYEELLQMYNQKVDMINRIWDVNESEKYQLAQDVLDPLEQTLYSSLLGIRSLDEEGKSESTKEYLATLRKEIERQLDQLKKSSISVYPICMQDLGPYGSIKSFYEMLKEGNKLTIDIDFKGMLNRQPHKIEILLYRFTQYLIRIIDKLNTVPSLNVSALEKDGQIVLTFGGENLVEQLKHSSEYLLFIDLVDSIGNVEIVEQNDCQINLVLHLNN